MTREDYEALCHIQDRLGEEEADPNVNLFIAVIENDLEGAKKALAGNANPNVRLGELFVKHAAQLSTFQPSAGGTLWTKARTLS